MSSFHLWIAAVLISQMLAHSDASIAETFDVGLKFKCQTFPAVAEGGLRLRGGADTASQMAEIRARRAREYEASRMKEKSDSVSDGSSLSPWVYTSGKVNPSTIGTREKKMAQGDARNYYLDHGVTVFRNRKTGIFFIARLHSPFLYVRDLQELFWRCSMIPAAGFSSVLWKELKLVL
jgi:hypothetical protein